MKIAEIEIVHLAKWIVQVPPNGPYPGPVEVHVLAQGYELRCGDLEPLRLNEAQMKRRPEV